MNVSTEAKTVLLNEAIAVMLDAMKADYLNNFAKRSGATSREEIRMDMYAKYCETLTVEEGRNYIKVITDRSVAGFICKKDNPKKGFVVGDMLKAASWAAPATNFARGNVFNEADANKVRWTGIL